MRGGFLLVSICPNCLYHVWYVSPFTVNGIRPSVLKTSEPAVETGNEAMKGMMFSNELKIPIPSVARIVRRPVSENRMVSYLSPFEEGDEAD